MTIVKVCGICDVDSAVVACDAGADMVGIVFAASRRQLGVEAARRIRAAVPAGTQLVGVFADQPIAEVNRVADAVGVDLVQLSGDESFMEVQAVRRPVIKVVHVRPGGDVATDVALFSDVAEHVLLDTWHETDAGGTGIPFDWTAVRAVASEIPVLVAGGLTPANVAQARAQTGAIGVDVSSGVETDGSKDHALIRAFVAAARKDEDG